MHLQVLGPDSGPLSPADLRRLFRGQRLTGARRNRLSRSGRIVATCGSRVAGLAAYERADGELRVYEFAVDIDLPCSGEDIAGGLLDALEVACLASGGRRLVLLPRAAHAQALLQRRGYTAIAENASGAWFQKNFA
jgi:hypothetical protein